MTPLVMCSVHLAFEPRAGRIWGRDGHLGVSQVRVLAWLALFSGRYHAADVVRMSGAGPALGMTAIDQLVEAGCIDRDPAGVTITDVGRESVALWPSQLAVFTRHSTGPDGQRLGARVDGTGFQYQ